MSHPPGTRFVMANHVKTSYLDLGTSATTLVALHGGGAGSSGSAGMGKLADRLQNDVRFLAPDGVGGFGYTDVNAPTPYGWQSRVDHLSDFADTLCLDKMHLIGNSAGAWVAARYAIQRPDRVKSMVLIGSGTIVSSMGLDLPPSKGVAALQAFDNTREGMRRVMGALVADPSKIPEHVVDERLASANRPGATEAMKRLAEGQKFLDKHPTMVGVRDMRLALPAITKVIPTLFIWGEHEVFVPIELVHELEKLLPDVRFVYLPDAGHQAQTDQPDVVADLVRKHVAAAE